MLSDREKLQLELLVADIFEHKQPHTEKKAIELFDELVGVIDASYTEYVDCNGIGNEGE